MTFDHVYTDVLINASIDIFSLYRCSINDDMFSCPLGESETGTTLNLNNIDFTDNIGGTANPFLHNRYNWPVSITITRIVKM